MKGFMITTDITGDLPDAYVKEHDLGILSLSYMIDGEIYDYHRPLETKDFYDKMRKGSMPTTSQINPDAAKEILEGYIKERDLNILHISFSSGLSGSYNSVCVAVKELAQQYPDNKIIVIDSLAASLGMGLMVYKAVELKASGKSMEEVATWIEDHKMNFVHNFTVDDLNHLHRGGRVSKATAVLGTMINIKPILRLDEEGHLVAVGKVRGRKKSLHTLVECMEKQMGSYRSQNDIVFISHGDTLEDAQYVAELVKEQLGIENVLINWVGPTIGAHSGPGTVALFYLGDVR